MLSCPIRMKLGFGLFGCLVHPFAPGDPPAVRGSFTAHQYFAHSRMKDVQARVDSTIHNCHHMSISCCCIIVRSMMTPCSQRGRGLPGEKEGEENPARPPHPL